MAVFEERSAVREIETAAQFEEAANALGRAVIQGVDLTSANVRWDAIDVEHAVFLGCTLPDGVADTLTRRGATMLPALPGRPYKPYRSALYTARELNAPSETPETSVDESIYEWYSRGGTYLPDIEEALAQRLHDFSIDDALSDLVGDTPQKRLDKRIVGIMGGHSAKRSLDPTRSYANAARVAHRLGRDHLIVTGGGPGIMEAANLGAYLSGQPEADLEWAIEKLAEAPDDKHPKYRAKADEVVARFPTGKQNLSIPTWFYGFEPSNRFATDIAKYFANSLREEGLLALCLSGIVYLDGAAGTVQEIFMDAAQNYYQTFGFISPMVFLPRARWEPAAGAGIVGALRAEAAKASDKRYADYIYVTDSPRDAADFIRSHPPLGKGATKPRSKEKVTLRLAAFNVENLFSQPRAFNRPDADRTLADHARINEIFQHDSYSDTDKQEILDILRRFNLLGTDGDPAKPQTLAILRSYRGELLRWNGSSSPTVTARGRSDWVGWLELVEDNITGAAIANTARVLREVDADIVGVVEAEDRHALLRFSDSLLRTDDGRLYPHVMVLDGNDSRGIDVGILAKAAYPVRSMRSHVDDEAGGGRLFSRDCPEYWFAFPESSSLAGQHLVVMVNHLKSKRGDGGGDLRRRQAERVAAIYQHLRDDGVAHIAVVGDLNDYPGSDPLVPLLRDTDLRDFAEVKSFDDGGLPGTYGNGGPEDKIDYLLLSPSLFERATHAAIFRLGVWSEPDGSLFPHFDTITSKVEAASDHAAVFVDIDIS